MNISSYGHDVVYTIWFFFESVSAIYRKIIFCLFERALITIVLILLNYCSNYKVQEENSKVNYYISSKELKQ